MSDEDRVSMVPSPKTKTERRLEGFKTKTKTCKNGTREVSRPTLVSRTPSLPWPYHFQAGADPGVEIGGGAYDERGARPYNGGLGAVPPAGSSPGAEPLVRDQGAKPP